MSSSSVGPGWPAPSEPFHGDVGTGAGPIAELLLPYDPTLLDQTVRRRRRRLAMRLISLGVSLAILGGIYAWQHAAIDAQGSAYWVFTGIVLAISLVPSVVLLLAFLRSRAERRRVPAGFAVRMGRPGVVVGTAFSRWDEVAALEIVPGGLARADRLRLRSHGGAVGLVPLDQVVAHPATLDSTARAYSGGRQGVDLSRLDN